MSDKNNKEEESSSKISVSVGGDVHGDIKAAGRDLIIDNSTNIDNSQHQLVTFDDARKKLEESSLDDDEKETAAKYVDKIEAESETPEGEIEQDKIDKWLGILETVAPDVVEVVVNAVTNPGAAVGSGLKTAVKAWRAARKK